jgi:hypothetical protein
MTNYNTQDGFAMIRELGALTATEGVDKSSKDKANRMITNIIDKVIEPAVQQYTALASGLKL